MARPLLYYIRHGETDWNVEGRLQGGHDIPLNAVGRKQAVACAAIVRDLMTLDRRDPGGCMYVASPLGRARETMELLRTSLGLTRDGYQVDARLREIGFGDWEGLTMREIRARDARALAERERDKWNFIPPGAESYAHVAARMREWYDGLPGDAVVVAHGGTARALIAVLGIKPPNKAPQVDIDQGVVYRFADGAMARTPEGRFDPAWPAGVPHRCGPGGNPMSFNTFGHLLRVTTFGESHGAAIGCVVDGCPPRIPLTEADIQPYLDKRRPGQSRFTTQRREPDAVKILSGVFSDEQTGRQVTTGTPITLMIENLDQRTKDYSEIKDTYRPGHADFTYDAKYGLRDYRGGGRASARETAARVAAGAVARKIVPGLSVRGALVQIGPHHIDRARWDWAEIERNAFFCPDAKAAAAFADYLDDVRKTGSSIGAVIEIVAEGVPAGLGAPVYGKLDGDIASGLMGINAVKGVEIGDGFAAALLSGEENADEIRMGNDGKPIFLSNHAGGILGGISTGQPIVARFAVKPTSSILTPRRTVDRYGRETEIVTKGRHDPCVGIRAVPIGEAMVACVIADHYLRQRGQVGDGPAWPLTPPR